jgi:hypothetical protein
MLFNALAHLFVARHSGSDEKHLPAKLSGKLPSKTALAASGTTDN